MTFDSCSEVCNFLNFSPKCSLSTGCLTFLRIYPALNPKIIPRSAIVSKSMEDTSISKYALNSVKDAKVI